MKKYIKITIVILLFTLLIISGTQQSCNNDLDTFIEPLSSGSPLDYSDEIFDELNILDDIKIIGIGEATHGTAEFFEFKHRLFRYLVEQKGFRALVKEISYMKSLQINDYVRYGQGDIDSICSDLGWIHSNNEAMGVIHWMENYNRDKPDKEKLYFLGIDSQLDMWEMDQHFSYIRNYDIKLSSNINHCQEQLLQFGKPDYTIMTETEYLTILDMLDSLILITEQFFKYNPGKPRREQILRLVEGLRYSHKFLFHIHQGKGAINYREEHLLESTLAIWKILKDSSGYMLWAHNAHVAMNPLYSDGQGSLGWLVKQNIAKYYSAIGACFATGSFIAVNLDTDGNDTPPKINVISASPPEGSINYHLQQVGMENFIINFRNIDNKHPLRSVFDSIRPFIDIGDLYMGEPGIHYTCDYDGCMNVWQSFDALVFFSETHAVTFE